MRQALSVVRKVNEHIWRPESLGGCGCTDPFIDRLLTDLCASRLEPFRSDLTRKL